MQIFNNDVIRAFSEFEEIRNMYLKNLDIELENILKLPEEERINNMDKMRILLRLRELYRNLDIKVVKNEMIFFKGKAVITDKQLVEICNMRDECYKETQEYIELMEQEPFVLTKEDEEQLKEYIQVREYILQYYLSVLLNSTPSILKDKDLTEIVTMISETNITLENGKVYLNGNLITTNKEYIDIIDKIYNINVKVGILYKKLT